MINTEALHTGGALQPANGINGTSGEYITTVH